MTKSIGNTIWEQTIIKVLPIALTCSIVVLGKAAYDVYAFTKTKDQLIASVKSNTQNHIKVDKMLDKKANQKDLYNVEKKVDKILTGLCMMDEKTCRLND